MSLVCLLSSRYRLHTRTTVRPKNSEPLSLEIETRSLAAFKDAEHPMRPLVAAVSCTMRNLSLTSPGSLQPLVLEISSFLHDDDCQHVIDKAMECGVLAPDQLCKVDPSQPDHGSCLLSLWLMFFEVGKVGICVPLALVP